MEYIVIVGLLSAFIFSHGFLLDDKTTSVTNINNAISAKEFNDLVILVSSERTARLKLEQRVTHLENELLRTQKGLTDVFHDNLRHNASLNNQNNVITSLASENAALKSKYDVLEIVNKELAINLTRTETELKNVKNKMNQLEQMKAVSDLQLVLNLQNDTNHLLDELKTTNSKLAHVSNENNVRKDDIIALYNTVSNNENKFISYAKNTSEVINRRSHDIVEKLSRNISDLTHHQNQTTEQLTQKISGLSQHQYKTEKQLTQKVDHLEQLLNVTSNMVERELHNMSGRVVLTACAFGKNYSAGSKILFPFINTRNGVSDPVISELGTAGNYRVESSGIYLVSAFIMTQATGTYKVYVNDREVAYGYFYIGSHYLTTSVTLSKHLEIHDVLSIKVNHEIQIYGIEQSCLTILQLTED